MAPSLSGRIDLYDCSILGRAANACALLRSLVYIRWVKLLVPRTVAQATADTMATYVITGTSKGIGLELTRQLSELPESDVKKVFAISRSQPSQALEDLIQGSNGRVVSVIASVCDSESVKRAADNIQCHVGTEGVDVLVNNAGVAGVTPGGSVVDMETEQMERCFDTNVIGPHRMIAVFMPLLSQGREKKVINM